MSSSITVAEDGNRRIGEMSNAELVQCILDIKTWFSRTKCSKNLQDPCSTSDIQKLEKSIDKELPTSLNILLSEINGGLYFMDKEQLSCQGITDIVNELDRSKLWDENFLPFCGNTDNLLLINLKGRNNSVFEWDSDEGLGDEVSPSLTRYLEDYRNDLLGGHFEYLDDVGVIEKMGNNTGKSKK